MWHAQIPAMNQLWHGRLIAEAGMACFLMPLATGKFGDKVMYYQSILKINWEKFAPF